MTIGMDQRGNRIQAVEVSHTGSYNLAVGASSVQSPAFSTAGAIVRVATDCNCRIEFGANPTASSSSPLVPGGSIEYFVVPQGASFKMAVIQHGTATGTINVTEY